MKTTLYQLLGVDPKASVEEIRAACARRIEAAEAAGHDANATVLLKQAFEVLTDPLRRNAYDASLAAAASGISSANRRRDAQSAEAVSTGAWIGIVVVVAAIVGAGVWTLARRDAPKPLPLQVEPKAAQPGPATAAPVAGVPPTAAESPAVPIVPVETRPPVRIVTVPARPAEGVTSGPVRPVEATASTAARSAENVYAEVAPSVVRVNVTDPADRTVGTGSGVVIEPGVVLTNCHVVKAGPNLTVKLGSSVLPATITLADEEYDLCRIAVAGLRAPPVRIGSVASLRTGQKVYAIGAPAGLELTISEGIVSSLRRIQEGTVIQTTAPISPGSSGGGLFDLSGQLVGIMTFQHRFGQNLNFALPADWIAQMRERGLGASGWRAATVAASTGDKSAGLLVGQWLCRDWISGRAGSFRFDPDGRVNIAMSEVPAVVLNYGMSGKSLVVFDKNKGAAMTINELSAKKMILKGSDRSIACER